MKKRLKKRFTAAPKTRPAGKVREFLLAKIDEHPVGLVKMAAKHFGISTVAVQRHLQRLQSKGAITKQGSTRNTRWVRAPSPVWRHEVALQGAEEDVIWKSLEVQLSKELSRNVLDIIRYGFTEMVNNAIDHSQGTKCVVEYSLVGSQLKLSIRDDGVGIFRLIQKAFSLQNARESILELTKGKVTTDPKRHSGEGIFFTSRAFDTFEIRSFELIFKKDNLNDDWLMSSDVQSVRSGTEIVLTLSERSNRVLRKVFDSYAASDEYGFDSTHILVELARKEETDFISRSQAKRILVGLEKFRRVTLDFRNVQSVGQAFVDEVFRVFAADHPETKFDCINTNDDVNFMIQRGLPKPKPKL